MSIACPKCRADTRVVDSRDQMDDERPNDIVRRRRKCRECAFRFTSFELAEESMRKLMKNGEELLRLRALLKGEAPSNMRAKERVGQVILRLLAARA